MEAYLQARVNDQLHDFYEPKAAESQRRYGQLRLAMLLLGGLGVVLGGIGAALEGAGWTAPWVAVIGTISGATAAFIFAGRYEYLAQSYELTARRLRWLITDWQRLPAAEKEHERGEFVNAFENVLSIENKQWVVEWQRKNMRDTEHKPVGSSMGH
jgi:hypothetical protein